METILAKMKDGSLSIEEGAKLIAEIGRAQGKAEASAPRSLSCKVGEKGGVSVTGLNVKFPITLYGDQWLRLLNFAENIREFIWENRGSMSWKDGKPAPTTREECGLPAVKLAKKAA